MPTKRDGSTLVLQAVVHRDVQRKVEALAERLGVKQSAVVALAINDLADAHRIILRDEVDPRQTSMFSDEGVAA
jgi:hypothetical protein